MPNTGHDFGGEISVRLDVSGGKVTAVNINSTRPEDASQIFINRKPSDVVGTLGLLFSLCGRAQTVAGLMAIEKAQGVSVAPQHAKARDLLRMAEMLSQTAMRVCMDWPRMLGLEPQPDVVRAQLKAEVELEAALFKGENWKVPGGIEFIPAVKAAHIHDVLGLDELAQNLTDSLTELGLNTFGAGTTVEDGALRRHWDEARVSKARQDFGAGMRARLEARIADLRTLPKLMRTCADALGPAMPDDKQPSANGEGEASVETARGMLTHSVTIKDGLVFAYDITAPTDGNFAPGGPVALGLIGADATDVEALAHAAQMHVLAIDPCVACEVEIDYA